MNDERPEIQQQLCDHCGGNMFTLASDNQTTCMKCTEAMQNGILIVVVRGRKQIRTGIVVSLSLEDANNLITGIDFEKERFFKMSLTDYRRDIEPRIPKEKTNDPKTDK